MKNLVVANHKVFSLKGGDQKSTREQHDVVVAEKSIENALIAVEALGSMMTMDVANHVLYYCTSNLTLMGYDLRNQCKTIEVPLVLGDDAEEPLLFPDDVIITIQYLPEKEAVFLATATGYLITVTVHSQSDKGTNLLSEAAMALIAESDDAVLNPFATPLDGDSEHKPESDIGAVEVLGLIEGGLTAAEWSPDKELLVLCGSTGGLLLMSKTWDVVVDTKLRGDDQANSAIVDANPYHYFQMQTNNFVTGAHKQLNTVGQMRMQQLRKPNAAEEKAQSDDEKDPEGDEGEIEADDAVIQAAQSSEAVRVFTASAQAAARAAEAAAKNGEDTDGTVSWRGDGQFFAVSSFNRISGTRTIRVWSRQGQLQSVSEPVSAQKLPIGTPVSQGRPSVDIDSEAGMHAILSWRPSGNWIASLQRTIEPGTVQGEVNKQHKVIFYEKNGLRRSEFNMYRPDTRVASAASVGCRSSLRISQLAWSADSELLTIVGTDAESGARIVQIWYTNNGHWYLKQTLVFPPLKSTTTDTTAPTQVSLHVMWHPDRTHRLYVAVDAHEFHLFDLCFDHTVSPAPLSSAAVIDGQTILITHLSKAAVPPPLASKALLCPDPIVDVAFCPTVALSNLLLKGDALAMPSEGSENHDTTQGGRYRSTGKGTFADIAPPPLAPLAPSALSAATQCSPAAVAIARGGTPGAAVRLDVTAPLAALTAMGDVLLFTEAAEAQQSGLDSRQATVSDKALFSQNPPHAPSHQPERYMLSSSSSATFAKPAAFAKLSISDVLRKAGIGSVSEGAAHFRHLQWADATQWLALHAALAASTEVCENLKRVSTDFGSDANATQIILQDFTQDTQIQHSPSLLGRVVARTINAPAHASNCITLIESKKGKDWHTTNSSDKVVTTNVPKSVPDSSADSSSPEPIARPESPSVNDMLQKAFAGAADDDDYNSEAGFGSINGHSDVESMAGESSGDIQEETQLENESEHLIQIQFRVYLTKSGTIEPFDILVRRFPIQAALQDPPARAAQYLSLLAGAQQSLAIPGRLALLSSVSVAAHDARVSQESPSNPLLETTSITAVQSGENGGSETATPLLISFSQPLVSRVFLVSPGRAPPDPSALFSAFGLGNQSNSTKPEGQTSAVEQAKSDLLTKITIDRNLSSWISSLTEAQKTAVTAYAREYAAFTTSRPWLAMLLSDGHVVAADLPFYAPTAVVASGSRLKSRTQTLEDNDGAEDHELVMQDDDHDTLSVEGFGAKPFTPKLKKLHIESPFAPKLLFSAPLAPMDCLWFLVTQIHHTTAIVVKDTLSRLWVNNVLIAPQCLSFSVLNFEDVASAINMGAEVSPFAGENLLNRRLLAATLPDPLLPSYLLVTVASQSHALFTLDLRRTLAENVDPVGPVRDDPSMVRFVERGAMIVSALADLQRPRIVLQQPRGNLEVIYPRALGLAAIQVALSRNDYLQAFLSMRANRIDLNLLYDHDPEQFERCVEDVVIQLTAATARSASASSTAGTDAISLFLSALTDEDCTKTQYPYYHAMFSELSARQVLAATVSSSPLLSTLISEHGVCLADADFDYSTHIQALQRNPKIAAQTTSSRKTPYGASVRMAELDDWRDSTSSVGNASSWDDQSGDKQKRMMKGPHGHESLEELAKALGQGKVRDPQEQSKTLAQPSPMPTVSEDDISLGEEAHADLTRDGTGMAVMKRESRVQRWSAAEMDIRHVYTQATEEQDAEDAVNRLKISQTKAKAQENKTQQAAASTSASSTEAGTIISELSALATTNTAMSKSATIAALASSNSKVNRVCSLILATLDRLDTDPLRRTYMLPALTAHLRSTPPQFSEAVARIATLAHAEATQTVAGNAKLNVPSTQTMPSASSSSPELVDPVTGMKFNPFRNPAESLLQPHPLAPSARGTSRRAQVTSAERALKYVLILADGNEIWRAALALYDLNLAASVAQFHGRDPKEYLPFLADLQRISKVGPPLSVTIDTERRSALAHVNIPSDMGETLMRAAIDVHLSRHARALAQWASALNLIATASQQTDLDQLVKEKLTCIAFSVRKSVLDTVKRAQLYELAVLLFGSNAQLSESLDGVNSEFSSMISSTPAPSVVDSESSNFSRQILGAYAAWLESSGVSRFADAAVVYRAIGEIRAACTAYGNAGMWQAAMGLAASAMTTPLLSSDSDVKTVTSPDNAMGQIPVFDAAGLVALAKHLARVATERKDYLASAELQYEYLNEPEVALTLLLRGSHWNEALALVAKHRMRVLKGISTSALLSAGAPQKSLMHDIFLPSLREAVAARVIQLQNAADRFPQAARRLRIVRRVKILIFSGRARKAATDAAAAVGTGEAARLPARIPGDDVLEFIITGVWRGVHTGFDVGGAEGIDSAASVAATSLAQYSTATGASLASLAPSIARSIRSARSAAASGVSVASQSSVLSAAALETALTADERRLLKYQQRKQKKQNKRKIKEGDPREELELVKELRQLAPQPGVDQVAVSALAHVLSLVGLEAERQSLLSAFANLLRVVAETEAIPMPTLEGGSEWQCEQIAAYFNWPASNYTTTPTSATGPKGSAAAADDDDDDENTPLTQASSSTASDVFYGSPATVGVRAALAVARPYGPWRSVSFVKSSEQVPAHTASEQVPVSKASIRCGDVMSPLAQLLSQDPRVRALTEAALIEEAETESRNLAIVMSSKRTQLGAASSAISANTAVSVLKN